MDPADKDHTFLAQRARLFRLAYRMLGTRQDAEDALQDAWLRWNESEVPALRSGEAWLVTLTTRLCIDRLRHLKVEREAYFGPWLPEPLFDAATEASPQAQLERAGDLSIAFLVLLERLAPEERAAFLLHEVFEFDHGEIAATLMRSEGACRQMIYRAKGRLKQGARFEATEAEHRALIDRFVQAALTGDRARLLALLAPEADFQADGGGKAQVVFKPLHGAERIMRLFEAVARQAQAQHARMDLMSLWFNGRWGLLRSFNGHPHSLLAFEMDARGQISEIYLIANPDKLKGLPVA